MWSHNSQLQQYMFNCNTQKFVPVTSSPDDSFTTAWIADLWPSQDSIPWPFLQRLNVLQRRKPRGKKGHISSESHRIVNFFFQKSWAIVSTRWNSLLTLGEFSQKNKWIYFLQNKIRSASVICPLHLYSVQVGGVWRTLNY